MGRSLREVDKRTAVLAWHVIVGWLISLFVTIAFIVLPDVLTYRLKKPEIHHETPATDL